MSQPPLTYLEKKWATPVYGSANTLIRGATQDNQRTQVPMLDYDTHRNVSNFGRRTLMSIGRYIYNNIHPLRNAVKEIARQSVSTYIPQYYGRNDAWGEIAEAWLHEGDKFIDVKGWPYNMGTFRKNFVESIIRDGDVGIILATVNDQPKLQMIPSHRIGSRVLQTTFVQGGPYDGARIIDGVIVDDYGAPIAYRVYGENGYDYANFEDISANDMLLCYMPDYADQCRGFSMLGAVVFEALDVADSRNFELIAQKIRASFAVQIENETGFVDKSKLVMSPPSSDAATSGAAQANPTQLAQPGTISYYKAGKNQGMKVLDYDRPGPNVMAFQKETLRSIFAGIGWSYDYSYEPNSNGGALRIAVDKINSFIFELQKLVIEPTFQRITGWRVAKGAKLKLIPEDEDWYKFRFQGPARITADEQYTSEVAINEIRSGIRAPQDAIEKMGGYWEEVQDKGIAFRARFNTKCADKQVDPDTVIWPGPNGVPPEQNPVKKRDPNA